MTRRIAQLIEEQENRSKLLRTRDLDVKVARTQEYLHKTEVPIPDREEILLLNLRKESQQREVTMPKENKNQNGTRNNEMKLIGKKA
jgi:nitrogen-specific signal transduction histidine kinase